MLRATLWGVRIALVLSLLLLAGCGAGAGDVPARPADPPSPVALPAPDDPLPRDPARLAARIASTAGALETAIDVWRAGGDPSRGAPPEDVSLLALDQQRAILLLSSRPRLFRAVLARLPARLRSVTREDVLARRELAAIHSVVRQRPRIRIGRPQPADRLRAHYRRAWRRFGVGWPLLAAVNLVESHFGRLRNESTAGAQGPMQFIPSTWRAYGLGGGVRDPRDAILGAANYLHANGAPGDEARALFHYNPSRLYVSAVRRYSRRMRADERAYYAYYAWQVFIRTPGGHRRLSGPGLGRSR